MKRTALCLACWRSFIGMFQEISRNLSKVCLFINTLRWHHDEGDGVSNHQHHDCLLNRLFRRRSKKTSKLRVTGLCGGIHRWLHKGPVTRKCFHLMTSSWENMIYENTSSKWTTVLVMHSRAILSVFPNDCFKPSNLKTYRVFFIKMHLCQINWPIYYEAPLY